MQASQAKLELFYRSWRANHSPMDWALVHKQRGTVALILKHEPGLLRLRHVERAIRDNLLDITELLLKQEPIKEKLRRHKASNEKSPIFAAVEQGSLKIASMITEICGPLDHSLTTSWGRTALHIACENGYLDVVRLLLDQGADPTLEMFNSAVAWEFRTTALTLAIWPKVFNSGLQVFRRQVLRSFGVTKYFPTEQAHINVVKEILSRNPDLDEPEQYLMLAVQAGRADILDILLEHGIQFSDQNSLDQMLHHAIYSGSIALVQRLLNLGAGVGQIDTAGHTEESMVIRTALQAVAVAKRFGGGAASVAIADLLMKHGAAVEHPHVNVPALPAYIVTHERSPLRFALEVDDIPLITFLLQASAHLVPHQVCPLYFVRSIEAIHLLEKYGLDIDQRGSDGSFPLIMVSRNRHPFALTEDVTSFHYLTDNVADINATDDKGRTALWHSCISDTFGERQMPHLLGKNADPNLADFEGRTGLHETIMHGSLDAIKLLAQYGANANVKDCKGFTPLHESMKLLNRPFYFENYIKIADYLLFQLNADPDARSHDGTFAMFLPASGFRHQEELAHMLLMYSKYKSPDHSQPYQPYAYDPDDLPLSSERFQPIHEKLRADDHVAALINRRDHAGNLLLVCIAGRIDHPNFHLDGSQSGRTVMSQALFLIELGADLNMADASGTTPLQAAINSGNDELRDHLRSLGASINAVCENGQIDN